MTHGEVIKSDKTIIELLVIIFRVNSNLLLRHVTQNRRAGAKTGRNAIPPLKSEPCACSCTDECSGKSGRSRGVRPPQGPTTAELSTDHYQPCGSEPFIGISGVPLPLHF
jgi:hypothetical protein